MTDEITPLGDARVRIDTLLFQYDNDMSVKLRKRDGAWEPEGCRWPAAWQDKELSRGDYGIGEVMDHDELQEKKSEAIRAARELDHVRDTND